MLYEFQSQRERIEGESQNDVITILIAFSFVQNRFLSSKIKIKAEILSYSLEVYLNWVFTLIYNLKDYFNPSNCETLLSNITNFEKLL